MIQGLATDVAGVPIAGASVHAVVGDERWYATSLSNGSFAIAVPRDAVLDTIIAQATSDDGPGLEGRVTPDPTDDRVPTIVLRP